MFVSEESGAPDAAASTCSWRSAVTLFYWGIFYGLPLIGLHLTLYRKTRFGSTRQYASFLLPCLEYSYLQLWTIHSKTHFIYGVSSRNAPFPPPPPHQTDIGGITVNTKQHVFPLKEITISNIHPWLYGASKCRISRNSSIGYVAEIMVKSVLQWQNHGEMNVFQIQNSLSPMRTQMPVVQKLFRLCSFKRIINIFVTYTDSKIGVWFWTSPNLSFFFLLQYRHYTSGRLLFYDTLTISILPTA